MRVVADTSALVTLEMVDLFDRVGFLALVTAAEVAAELEELAEFEDTEATAAQNLLVRLDEGIIDVHPAQQEAVLEQLVSPRVQRGEAACFQVCRQTGAEVFLTDDARAIAGLRDEAMRAGIRLRISAAVIAELLERGAISPKRARSLVAKIVQTRGWEGGVLEVLAQRLLGE